jgi:hypothetical protein
LRRWAILLATGLGLLAVVCQTFCGRTTSFHVYSARETRPYLKQKWGNGSSEALVEAQPGPLDAHERLSPIDFPLGILHLVGARG